MPSSEDLTLEPVTRFAGQVTLPGSKSLTNRALLLAAMSPSQTQLDHLLVSDDSRYMLEALKALGVGVSADGPVHTRVVITGLGPDFPGHKQPHKPLYLGNAGTAMRPLCAALALSGRFEYELTGEPRMYERPIGPLVAALHEQGADISYLGEQGYPPLRIRPFKSRKVAHSVLQKKGGGLHFRLDASLSSQYVTALLMALPMRSEPSCLELAGELVSLPYIDITLKTMARFGVEVEASADRRFYHFTGSENYQSPGRFLIEGDASSASYFLAGAAISGGPVAVRGIGTASVQGDVAFCEALEAMGAEIHYEEDQIVVRGGRLQGVDLDLNHIPDAAMTLAVVALFAKGPTRIRNIYNWRLKETDRLAAMATELQKVGAQVEEGKDFLVIHPPRRLQAASIATYNDHRMAMCFSLVCLGGCPVTIQDPGCTAKTYPDYFQDFASLCHR